MASQHKRRLRKKLYLEEFAVFGFEVTCKSNVRSDEDDCLLETFLEFIESRNLMFGGGFYMDEFSGFLCSHIRYKSASDEDRTVVKAWLEAQPRLSDVVIGELVDVHYGI